MDTNSKTPTRTLGTAVCNARRRAGLSIRACAANASVDATWLSRLERGSYTSPDPRHLQRLARVLNLDIGDLYVAAGYQPGRGLPTFAPYLRARYELPEEAIAQLAAHFELLEDKYRPHDRGSE